MPIQLNEQNGGNLLTVSGAGNTTVSGVIGGASGGFRASSRQQPRPSRAAATGPNAPQNSGIHI